MGHTLYIAEKPSLGRAIAEGLGGAAKRGDGYIECHNGNRVTWCFGHLLGLVEPEAYDARYKRWDPADLPIVPEKWRKTASGDGAKQLKVIRRELKGATEVVNAGDPDREGQLLVDEVIEDCGWSKPVKRLLLASLDPTSVRKALADLRDNREFRGLRDAADARSKADWLVGMNLTRAMTVAARDQGVRGTVVSVGRVQSPTLALVVRRDLEIERFVPHDYFVPVLALDHRQGAFVAYWRAPEDSPGLDSEGRLIDRDVAARLVAGLNGAKAVVESFDEKEKREIPPLPYSLSALQKDAGSRFGLSADQVLKAAQGLYEAKLTTYPRSDCRYLPEEQHGDARKVLESLAGLEGMPDSVRQAARAADAGRKGKAWNTKKITAHHAIVPTGLTGGIGSLKDEQSKVYRLVAERFVQQFLSDYRYRAAVAVLRTGTGASEQRWKASGRRVLDRGWRALSEEGSSSALPALEQGEEVPVAEARVENRKTKPPERFTDGSLIEAMASIHRFVDDPEIKKRLKESAGIGTEATRASMIETLIKRTYVLRKGKQLVSTPLGREVVAALPEGVADPGVTALWETYLDRIARGKVEPTAFLNNLTRLLPGMIDACGKAEFKSGGPVHPCPECGKALRRFASRGNKRSYYWSCPNREHPLLADDDGKPGRAFERREAA